MKYDLVIFDLDGTTLNTLGDLTDACNAALVAHGFAPHTEEAIRMCIGSGISNLIRNALPEGTGDDVHGRVLEMFRTYYEEHVDVKTAPYPGVSEMLAVLREKGVRIAFNSNKIDSAVQVLCAHHFPGISEMSLGERPDVPRKPSPEGVRRIMSALNASPARTLYVGDSNIDILTAGNAGIDCAWVSWGYRHLDELGDLQVPHAFNTAEDLTTFILEE